MERLETGSIGIGNTSTLATSINDRFIIVDQKEIFWTGAATRAPLFKSQFFADMVI